MKLNGEVFQFLSSQNVSNQALGHYKLSPRQHPDISFSLSFELVNKPFEINFAQVVGSSPSIGFAEFIDPYIDVYMEERWPKCLQGLGTIEIPKEPQSLSAELIRNILAFLRLSAWTLKDRVTGVLAAPDQLASHLGYRREYLDRQIFDVSGNRRPNSSENYVPTDAGEYVGPGVAFLPNIDPFKNRNELVWSQIITFPNRTTLTDDLPIIRRKATEIRKHYNSYNELVDARRFLRQGDVKACVRSAASAVDAILRYYCGQWDVAFPKKSLAFDEKIEEIIVSARRPSYKSAAPDNLQKLLYLYRARNAMHEGDCYYKDKSGNKIEVKSVNQCAPFVDVVEQFVIWIDSIV